MKLSEAIEHLQQTINSHSLSCIECENEHRQLLDWLLELYSIKGDME